MSFGQRSWCAPESGLLVESPVSLSDLEAGSLLTVCATYVSSSIEMQGSAPQRLLFLIAYGAPGRAVAPCGMGHCGRLYSLPSSSTAVSPPALPVFSWLREPCFCSDIWHGAVSRKGGFLPRTLGWIMAGIILCAVLVAKSCLTLCDPMDCSLPGSSVHGILQARILEWVAISFSTGSSWPRDQTCISCIGRWILYHWATRKTWVMGSCYYCSLTDVETETLSYR